VAVTSLVLILLVLPGGVTPGPTILLGASLGVCLALLTLAVLGYHRRLRIHTLYNSDRQ
jgi:hypothetical protein